MYRNLCRKPGFIGFYEQGAHGDGESLPPRVLYARVAQCSAPPAARSQLEKSHAYAESHNLELVEEFRLEDLGVSAFKGANADTGALGKFLEAVRANAIQKGSYLLVESLDRLSRQQVMKSLGIFTEIINAGINIATLADGRVCGRADRGLDCPKAPWRYPEAPTCPSMSLWPASAIGCPMGSLAPQRTTKIGRSKWVPNGALVG